MRRAALLAGIAVTTALLIDAPVAGQQELVPESALVAFRVDANRVIATLKVRGSAERQVTQGLSAEPIARYGYRHFDPPASWREQDAAGMREGDPWLIHAAPGQVFEAEAERIVGGQAGCQDATGVLLRVASEQSGAFMALPAKYFLAERSMTLPELKADSDSRVGVARSPRPAEFRRPLEAALNELLARELPAFRTVAAPNLARAASSSVGYHRSWARQLQAVEDAMQSGRGELTYDVQSFRLAPDGVLLHFVRAEWTVQRRQGFAVSLWLRGGQPLEVIQTNLRPALWLRSFEFQGKVAREHLGLILNIFDRDHDGWGEVLMAGSGYESTSLSLLEYSPSGFQPTGIEYGYGC